jgi:hypothetical protein
MRKSGTPLVKATGVFVQPRKALPPGAASFSLSSVKSVPLSLAMMSEPRVEGTTPSGSTQGPPQGVEYWKNASTEFASCSRSRQ